jgi:hypothetical protein
MEARAAYTRAVRGIIVWLALGAVVGAGLALWAATTQVTLPGARPGELAVCGTALDRSPELVQALGGNLSPGVRARLVSRQVAERIDACESGRDRQQVLAGLAATGALACTLVAVTIIFRRHKPRGVPPV